VELPLPTISKSLKLKLLSGRERPLTAGASSQSSSRSLSLAGNALLRREPPVRVHLVPCLWQGTPSYGGSLQSDISSFHLVPCLWQGTPSYGGSLQSEFISFPVSGRERPLTAGASSQSSSRSLSLAGNALLRREPPVRYK